MNKEYHLKESKTFCMVPWVHLHTSPTGVAAPCCIAESIVTPQGVGNAKTQSLMELVNSEKMNQLRMDMVAGVKNEECKKCHNQEENNISSFRQNMNREYGSYYDDVIKNTNDDGSLSEFKMHYFDIRFNNICNFKCRTCGSDFSTQWEQEDLKNKLPYARIVPKNDNPEFLKEVVEQIDFMKIAYFAGGEPLITEEHYVMLEEMIKRGRTDIQLRYNTNLSNLKFKDKDLLGLWKYFSKQIEVYASIDHYGERAEYIRHGTDWVTVENNFITLKKNPFISLQMNTVLSAFNAVTIGDFYQYIIDKEMYDSKSMTYSLYNMTDPVHISPHILPKEYKEKSINGLSKIIQLMKQRKFIPNAYEHLEQSTDWIYSQSTWEQQKDKFRSEIQRLDKIRGEDFSKTFPELAGLL